MLPDASAYDWLVLSNEVIFDLKAIGEYNKKTS